MTQDSFAGAFAVDRATADALKSEMDGKYLSFWTDNQLFGVPIADVVQIVGVQTITELPDAPHYVRGIIHLRGNIIPIVDVRLRFGKPQQEYDERTCIIVTNFHEMLMGFAVDAVNEVTDLDSDSISPPPQLGGETFSAFITGIAQKEQQIILLISTKKLLGENELDQLTQVMMEGALQ